MMIADDSLALEGLELSAASMRRSPLLMPGPVSELCICRGSVAVTNNASTAQGFGDWISEADLLMELPANVSSSFLFLLAISFPYYSQG